MNSSVEQPILHLENLLEKKPEIGSIIGTHLPKRSLNIFYHQELSSGLENPDEMSRMIIMEFHVALSKASSSADPVNEKSS